MNIALFKRVQVAKEHHMGYAACLRGIDLSILQMLAPAMSMTMCRNGDPGLCAAWARPSHLDEDE